MKVLVTGATGFLGSHLVEVLADKGYKIAAMVRETSNTELIKDLVYELRYGDLGAPENLPKAVKDVDAIIHLAAYYTFHGSKKLYELINVEGTKHLAEAALKNKVQHFIYCSTTEAIGPVKNPPGDENTEPNPVYEYGKSKLKAEEVIKAYGLKGLNYTIIRPSGIYGPRNIFDVSYWTITSFAKNSIATKFIVGSGENLVQFVHVRDVVEGFALTLEKSDVSNRQTYIISEDKYYTYNQVYRILAELTGRKPPSTHIPKIIAKILIAPIEGVNKLFGKENFLYHTSTVDSVCSDRAYSIEKARRELGYRPKYDLKTGLKETIEWYIENGYI
ncbi:MAG: NAD-dependent epimerase/dehydratase family protein [Candidatus Odinarchaeum yellowstonii]|uniref:NAD-dependent epimerase/dehydratase family protein n=1 Tax=Odinarchaeota yellowstonii (strain LCB_4) TaxID=1841599 RepID=A0AAF0D2D5_ODILC|nr:MAG: NAD-dependent epimerase/dehydratase family protein [Candidatus Odinarchaeum yellowstonii]